MKRLLLVLAAVVLLTTATVPSFADGESQGPRSTAVSDNRLPLGDYWGAVRVVIL